MGSQPADRQGGTPKIERIAVGEGVDRREIAVIGRKGASPGLFWLGGFKSDMAGTKAEALDAYAARRGLAMTRFDYSGHGVSGGAFSDGTISRWLEEAQAVFDRMTEGPQILIGSSMGGWLALLLNQAHRSAVGADRSRVAGLVLIAPAVDMTRALIWAEMPAAVRDELMEKGAWRRPSDYSDAPYLITRALIEDGDRHLFGDRLIVTGCPVHILQGRLDTDVPWRHAADLVSRLASDDVVLTLIKDGDHRLSRPEDIARLEAAIEGIMAEE
jgi:alpha-beta hydrolase superfamily lysophospholipase